MDAYLGIIAIPAMGARIPELVQNPTVYYRLDPGEPGVARPAPASSSAITVTGQESRNRARLKSEALREGRQVLFVGTKYKVRRQGSYITAVGGTTTVITKSRPEAEQAAGLAGTSAPAGSPTSPTTPDLSDPEVVREGAQLRAEQQRLEQEQQTLKREVQRGDGPESVRAKQRLGTIEQRLTQVEARLEQLGYQAGLSASSASVGSPGMALSTSALNASLQSAGQLLDVLV